MSNLVDRSKQFAEQEVSLPMLGVSRTFKVIVTDGPMSYISAAENPAHIDIIITLLVSSFSIISLRWISSVKGQPA